MKFFSVTTVLLALTAHSVGARKKSTALAARSAAYTVPPGSPGFYHGNSSSAVTFDAHSLFLNNKRLFVFAGEFHPWRLPSGPAAWKDVLQKMKAAGFNAVSVYHHWGLAEGKQGSLDFGGYRSHEDFYQVAKDVGILVISRPGPYINAETTGGGFPGWLTNNPNLARTNETLFTEAWQGYIRAASRFAAPFQYPDGPVIAVQVENEFFPQDDVNRPDKSGEMVALENAMRENGITKVPLTHNDVGILGDWISGIGQVDLYTWDSYPNGFDCSHPDQWSNVADTLEQQHMQTDPDQPWAIGEFQGGSFDPWGGSGYDQCYKLLNEQFANVFYKNNYAAGVVWQNLYMAFGGTNWGNLAEPTVYTSYDYGAALREDRSISPKYSEIKLQALFLHASPPILVAERVSAGNGTAGGASTSAVYVTAMKSPDGTGFYTARQSDNSNESDVDFKLALNTSAGALTVPQFGGSITLAGRESKILVTDYVFGKSKLLYSTAEVMTWTTIDKTDTIVLYALAGQTIEAVLPLSELANITMSGSSSIKATRANSTAAITGSPSGVSIITIGTDTRVIVLDKATALGWWNPRLGGGYDTAPDVPSVLVSGPYLVRSADLSDSGRTLALTGDVNGSTTLDVLAPASVGGITWNGASVKVQRSALGTLRGSVAFGVERPSLPDLKEADWACVDSLPEVKSGFDDRAWVTADHTTTVKPLKPFAGKYVLYADDYGFHQGNTLYRGHFEGTQATSVWLSVQGGFNFGYSVWLNDVFLGSSQGTNQYSAGGGTDLTNVTFTFPEGSLKQSDNVVTVLLDQTGLEEDFNADDSFKNPRGIRGYVLNGGGDFDHWKIIGNFKGEDYPDKVRGPLNEGGLFVEREGAHLPGFVTSNWNTSCSPLTGIEHAGVVAYRTTFALDLPQGSDIAVALNIARTPSSNYRSVLFVNGWQFGRFSSNDGPQTVFPLPDGIINSRGKNEMLLTIFALDAKGAQIADFGLITTTVLASGKEPIPGGTVKSPSFEEVRGKQ